MFIRKNQQGSKMRISEKKLRSAIKKTIKEMSYGMPSFATDMYDDEVHDSTTHSDAEYHGSVIHDHSSSMISRDNLMKKASSCMQMDLQKFFMMCTMICSQNSEMASCCLKLCKCMCDGDIEGCCDCLDEICSCPECCKICEACCKF